MADQLTDFINSPTFIYLAIGLFAILIIVYFITRKKGQKEFKPQELKVTFKEDLKDKVDTLGIPLQTGIWKFLWNLIFNDETKLIRDFNKVASLERYVILKTVIPKYTFDKKTKDFITLKDTVKIEMLVLRAYSPFFLWKILGIKKKYFLFDMKNKDKLFRFDPLLNAVVIQGQVDFTSYGRIWCIDEAGTEYLNNVSIKRMIEQVNMWLENAPDRIIHLDSQQSKVERTNKTIADLEKQKYDSRKDIGETTVT